MTCEDAPCCGCCDVNGGLITDPTLINEIEEAAAVDGYDYFDDQRAVADAMYQDYVEIAQDDMLDQEFEDRISGTGE